METKKMEIEKNKTKFRNQIHAIQTNLENNIEIANNLTSNHFEFIKFSETMKIYEIYQWTDLKYTYKNIKEKISKDKKLANKIVKFYGNIINYFDPAEIEYFNNKTVLVHCLNDQMILSFYLLSNAHKIVLNKCGSMAKSDVFIKIKQINAIVKPIILKIYENYIDIQILNNKYIKLNHEKAKVLNDINTSKKLKFNH